VPEGKQFFQTVFVFIRVPSGHKGNKLTIAEEKHSQYQSRCR